MKTLLAILGAVACASVLLPILLGVVSVPFYLLAIFGLSVPVALFSSWLIFGEDHPDWSSSSWAALFMAAVGFPACGVVFVGVAYVAWVLLSRMTNAYL